MVHFPRSYLLVLRAGHVQFRLIRTRHSFDGVDLDVWVWDKAPKNMKTTLKIIGEDIQAMDRMGEGGAEQMLGLIILDTLLFMAAGGAGLFAVSAALLAQAFYELLEAVALVLSWVSRLGFQGGWTGRQGRLIRRGCAGITAGIGILLFTAGLATLGTAVYHLLYPTAPQTPWWIAGVMLGGWILKVRLLRRSAGGEESGLMAYERPNGSRWHVGLWGLGLTVVSLTASRMGLPGIDGSVGVLMASSLMVYAARLVKWAADVVLERGVTPERIRDLVVFTRAQEEVGEILELDVRDYGRLHTVTLSIVPAVEVLGGASDGGVQALEARLQARMPDLMIVARWACRR